MIRLVEHNISIKEHKYYRKILKYKIFINNFYLLSLQAGESSGLFKKTISKLSTEYRLQFVWPNVRRAIKVGGVGDSGGGGGGTGDDDVIEPPKKSKSMGAIKSAQPNHIPMVHKKRTTNVREGVRL